MILKLTMIFLAMAFIPIVAIALSISFVTLDLSLMSPLYWPEGVRGLCVVWVITVFMFMFMLTAMCNQE